MVFPDNHFAHIIFYMPISTFPYKFGWSLALWPEQLRDGDDVCHAKDHGHHAKTVEPQLQRPLEGCAMDCRIKLNTTCHSSNVCGLINLPVPSSRAKEPFESPAIKLTEDGRQGSSTWPSYNGNLNNQ